MCQKCVKRAKNLGEPTTVKPGLLRVLTYQFDRGWGIPLFCERAANYAVEAGLYLLQQSRTNKKRYSRKGRRQVFNNTD